MTASAEISFSRLEIIKSEWRSKVGQEQLIGFPILSVESDIAEKFIYDNGTWHICKDVGKQAEN